ncbi:hypothetical protein B0J14DRAFT_571234 [Halenospora varia]|nr:hypothetical protein B0J14DRAFT_571234 [Halenospora varia]
MYYARSSRHGRPSSTANPPSAPHNNGQSTGQARHHLKPEYTSMFGVGIAKRLKPLQLNRYKVEDLADLLIENAQKPILGRVMTPDQFTLRGEIPNGLAELNDTEELRQLCVKWFRLFDKFFFFGLLVENQVDIDLLEPGRQRPNVGIYNHDPTQGDVGISINPDAESPDPQVTREEFYVAAILHECVHAFFEYYRCHCSACERKLPATEGGIGEGRHGAPWAEALTVLERIFQEAVRWKVLCGVDAGVKAEMNHCGWIPAPEQLKRWGVHSIHNLGRRGYGNRARRPHQVYDHGPRRDHRPSSRRHVEEDFEDHGNRARQPQQDYGHGFGREHRPSSRRHFEDFDGGFLDDDENDGNSEMLRRAGIIITHGSGMHGRSSGRRDRRPSSRQHVREDIDVDEHDGTSEMLRRAGITITHGSGMHRRSSGRPGHRLLGQGALHRSQSNRY